MTIKYTDRQHEIIARALELFANSEHERAMELHRAKFAQTAFAREDLCCDALDLAKQIKAEREAPEPLRLTEARTWLLREALETTITVLRVHATQAARERAEAMAEMLAELHEQSAVAEIDHG